MLNSQILISEKARDTLNLFQELTKEKHGPECIDTFEITEYIKNRMIL